MTQMAQNFEGSWPDIGQQIASTTTNVPTSTQLTPNVTCAGSICRRAAGGLFPAATPFGSQKWFFDPNIKNAYSEQWNFGVQRQLSGSTGLESGLRGVHYASRQRWRPLRHRAHAGSRRLNPEGALPLRPPTFYDRSVGTGSYNALQVQLDKRYSKRLLLPDSLHLGKIADGRRRLVRH